MIIGNSKDPVFIKKINLNLWELRHEIEAVIRERLAACGNDRSKVDLSDLKELYNPTPSTESSLADNNGFEDDAEAAMAAAIAEGDEEDTSEADMAAAMEGGDEDTSEADMAAAMEGGDEDTSEADMAAAMLGGQVEPLAQGPSKVKLYRPRISKEQLITGVAFLSEINISQISLFCTRPLIFGQSVMIEFLVPKKFILSGQVVICTPYNLKGRIISDKKPNYRAIIDFSFVRPGEKSLLRDFLLSIEPDFTIEEAPVAVSGGGDDDDFDDLDDFDL